MTAAPPWSSGKLLRRARRARYALLVAVGTVALDLLWALLGTVLTGGFWPVTDWAAWWEPVAQGFVVVLAAAMLVAAWFVVRCQRELLRALSRAGVAVLAPGVTLSTFAWVLPFANLFLPLTAFRQLAAAAGPGRDLPLRRALNTWWALWIGGSLANRLASGIHKLGEESGTWLLAAAFALAGGALLVWAGLLLAAILPRLAEQQGELHMLLAALPGERLAFRSAEELGDWWRWTVRPAAPFATPPPLPGAT